MELELARQRDLQLRNRDRYAPEALLPTDVAGFRALVAERSRELATLRVIGFTRAEVSLLLLGELAVITLAAIPLGLALGYGLGAAVIWMAYDTELFRIPLVIDRSTYGFAAVAVLAATVLSALVVRRLIDRLDLVAVLKSKE